MRARRIIEIVVFAAIGFALPGYLLFKSWRSPARIGAVAVVNGEPILARDVIAASINLKTFDHYEQEHRQAVIREAVNVYWLANEAQRLGLEKTDPELKELLDEEEHFWLKREARSHLLGRRTKNTFLTDAEFRAYVEQHKQQLFEKDDVSFLIRYVQTESEAQELAEKLKRGGKLSDLELGPDWHKSGMHSHDQNKFLSPAEVTDDGMRRAVWQTPVGQAAGPLPLDGAFFFVQPVQRREGRPRTFDSIYQQLYTRLSELSYDRELKQQVAALAEKYPAQVDSQQVLKLAAGEPLPPDTVVATLQDRRLTARRLLDSHWVWESEVPPIPKRVDFWLQTHRLLLYARDNNLRQSAEVRAEMDAWNRWHLANAARRHLSSQLAIDKAAVEAEVEKVLGKIRAKYSPQTVQMKLEGLLVGDLATGERLHKKLQEGSTFAELSIHSVNKEKRTDLGWLWPWEIDEKVADALIDAPDQTVVGPIVTDNHGVWLVRRLDRRVGTPPMEGLKAKLLVRETTKAVEQAQARHLDQIWANAKVEVDWDELEKMWKKTPHFTGRMAAKEVNVAGRDAPTANAPVDEDPRHEHEHGGGEHEAEHKGTTATAGGRAP